MIIFSSLPWQTPLRQYFLNRSDPTIHHIRGCNYIGAGLGEGERLLREQRKTSSIIDGSILKEKLNVNISTQKVGSV